MFSREAISGEVDKKGSPLLYLNRDQAGLRCPLDAGSQNGN